MEAFMALARKYRDVEELTTPMIYDFVDRIIVHAPQKINGERHMQVEIILRFIGNFQAPRPESTAEEIEQAEKDRQRRAQNRERDARRREKKRLNSRRRSVRYRMKTDKYTKWTALYERLSRDDDTLGDSVSIAHQKTYLRKYADEHGFANCHDYTDDGWSGGTFAEVR